MMRTVRLEMVQDRHSGAPACYAPTIATTPFAALLVRQNAEVSNAPIRARDRSYSEAV
jgi:hypothetical protein